MKVLIVSPYRTVAPHFENELELAQRHLDDGDDVEFLSCMGGAKELANCEFNPTGEATACRDCRLRRNHGFSMLEGRVSRTDFAGAKLVEPFRSMPDRLPSESFFSVEQLKATYVDNFDVGSATLSSLISQVRDPEIQLSEYSDDLERFSQSALQVYRTVLDRLDRSDSKGGRPDRVYVFNGRFVAMRAVLRACESAGVDCFLHERGCDPNHYQLFKNKMPHLLEVYQARMRQHWADAATNSDRGSIAADWFRGRIQRVEKTWHSFVKNQQQGRLPDDWNTSDHNIVVFTSSADECVALGDGWSDRIYPNQGDAIRSLAGRLATERPDAMLTIRIHPNEGNVDNVRSRRLLNLDLPNVRVVPPLASVDSYHLMRVADTVATFGSTIGIEAVFWSKPSVLLAPSFYRDFSGPYRATDHEHAVRLLSNDLMPATNHDALIYGFWFNTNGFPYKYFEGDGLFSGKFKGQVIYAAEPKTISSRFRKQLASVKKRVTPSRKRAA